MPSGLGAFLALLLRKAHSTSSICISATSFDKGETWSVVAIASKNIFRCCGSVWMWLFISVEFGESLEDLYGRAMWTALIVNNMVYQYLLKPTHAQIESHIKTHYSKTLKCLCPYCPTCFGHQTDHHQGLNVSHSATCSPYVVFLHNLTLACGLLSVKT